MGQSELCPYCRCTSHAYVAHATSAEAQKTAPQGHHDRRTGFEATAAAADAGSQRHPSGDDKSQYVPIKKKYRSPIVVIV